LRQRGETLLTGDELLDAAGLTQHTWDESLGAQP
jgi:hypothetical protein